MSRHQKPTREQPTGYNAIKPRQQHRAGRWSPRTACRCLVCGQEMAELTHAHAEK